MAVLQTWAAALSAWYGFLPPASSGCSAIDTVAHSIFPGGRLDVPEAAHEAARGRVLTEVVWKPSSDCGHSVIDAQHHSTTEDLKLSRYLWSRPDSANRHTRPGAPEGTKMPSPKPVPAFSVAL
jgi:hypothetical protein